MPTSLTPEQRQRVMAIYAADAAVAAAGPRCDASGRCCRFTEYGHTLFLSHLEADVLLAAATYLRQLEELDAGGRYAPLHVVLNEAKASRGRERPEVLPPVAHAPGSPDRIALPLISSE